MADESIKIYRYPKYIGNIITFLAFSLIMLILFYIPTSTEEFYEEINGWGWGEIASLIYVFILNPLFCVYLLKTRVILFDDRILKKIFFIKWQMKYADVKKIVIYHSSGNPFAAMSRLYGDGSISIENLLEDYDSLINEVIYKCKSAVVIEKQK